MATGAKMRLLFQIVLLLLVYSEVTAGSRHDCSPEDTRDYLESKIGEDVAYVKHDSTGNCVVKLRYSQG
jgi:hypothetical protein